MMAPLAGCSSHASGKSDDDYRRDVTTGMHDALLIEIDSLVQASLDVESAAPLPKGRGWDPQQDQDALKNMKDAWVRARTAYERFEGALAPLFPDIDNSIDARYDDFMSELQGLGDPTPFDDHGVTGLHAVERILYSDVTPPRIVEFEKILPGYRAAAFPATEEEAAEFKTKLCAKLVADAKLLHDQWQPANIDLAGAFQGLISLMNEQREKVSKASTSAEESRYSQRTMADIRDNLAGTRAIYELFQPWVTSKANGATTDANIDSGFRDLGVVYAQYPGDAIPPPPATWSSLSPSGADLSSPFGMLYASVKAATDPSKSGSVVDEMNKAATLLGFPEFKESP